MDEQSADERLARAEAELARATELAEVYKEELTSFVYAASHDLRQPMRSINSYTQLLLRAENKEEAAREFGPFILDGVRAATDLLEQLLNFSRVGNSTTRVELKLAAAVQAAMYKLQPQIKAAGATVTCGELPEAIVNQADLERVFEILIDNAIKYRGAEAPKIAVSSQETAEQCVITVADNGPGIPAQYRREVLKPFKRLHDSKIPGSGLGLAMCRKIVLAHGGSLWIDGAEGSGAAVRFTLPLL